MSGDILGHPRALAYLFATEMWERFSYYGMRALLVLYMLKYLFVPQRANEVLGLSGLSSTRWNFQFGPLAPWQPLASQIYGFYTGLVYLTPILGGLIADRVLGQRRTVIVGATLMAIGHFMMAFEQLFLLALGFLILGNGAFKPNISTQVGALYAPGDRRRDRAFSIFYVGINLGAFLAPLICGTLGEELGWHYGFAAAGVGMTIGLITYLAATPTLPKDAFEKRATLTAPLDRTAWRSIAALFLLFAPVSLFWATYEQQGNTITLWADQFTEPPFSWRRNSGDLVSGVQSFHDFRLHTFHCRSLASPREKRAIDNNEAGYRLSVKRPGLSGHDDSGLDHRWWKGKLAVAARIFRCHHNRRTLSLANQPLPRDENCTIVLAVDDDGRMAVDQFCRRISCRLSRHVLVKHGVVEILLPDACTHYPPQRESHQLRFCASRSNRYCRISRGAAPHLLLGQEVAAAFLRARQDNRDQRAGAGGQKPIHSETGAG